MNKIRYKIGDKIKLNRTLEAMTSIILKDSIVVITKVHPEFGYSITKVNDENEPLFLALEESPITLSKCGWDIGCKI